MDDTGLLSSLLAEATGLPAGHFAADTRFESVEGWGSLTALRLLVRLEALTGVELDLRRYLACETVGELTGLLHSAQA
ncbi:phosphopantetheine-binding protein [Streptomyces sp. NPDC012616]|uniref:acyl carrier protein n=1 Tax=Streptomyces sp. NPDC012616 TaxID=3364840 RepID=UPI0036EA9420